MCVHRLDGKRKWNSTNCLLLIPTSTTSAFFSYIYFVVVFLNEVNFKTQSFCYSISCCYINTFDSLTRSKISYCCARWSEKRGREKDESEQSGGCSTIERGFWDWCSYYFYTLNMLLKVTQDSFGKDINIFSCLCNMKSFAKALQNVFGFFVAQHIRYRTERREIYYIISLGMHVDILEEEIILKERNFS